MKKFIAILLSALLVAAVIAIPVAANEDAVEPKMFWATHVNDNTVEGAGVIFTEAYSGAAWWIHVAFAPVEGAEGVFEITAISCGLDAGDGVAQAIPEGGFVWAANYGNDYPSLGLGDTDYTSPNCKAAIDDARTWEVGAQFVFDGIDPLNPEIPSSDVNWYDDAYVCEFTYAPYTANEDGEGEGEGTEGGDTETEPSEPVASENVAAGKGYTASEQFRMGGAEVNWGWDENAPIIYPDEDGITMTDGILPATDAEYGATEWAGWNGGTPSVKDGLGYNWITIDLGESYDLAKYVVWCGDLGLGAGIGAPDKIEVFVSEDGQTWADEATASVEPAKEDGLILKEVVLEGEATGRYVQFRFHCGTWNFLAELEVYNKGTEGGNGSTEPSEPTEPEVSLEDELKEFVGEASADAKFDLEINAPETYKAGDEITVTVTVKNITAENGLHVVNFNLYYDYEKLVLTNDLDEEEDNRLLCIDDENLPSKWENFTKVNNDFDPANEEGTEVKALNDGVIYASALTDKDTASTAIKEDGAVVFTFTFTAVEDAEGDIGIAIPNAEVEGALNNAAGAEKYAGNGGYAIIAGEADEDVSEDVSGDVSEDSSEDSSEEEVVPGDASSMIVFAIIALVAIAGSAVVIKSRR